MSYLPQLRTFLTIYRQNSISKAAEVLHLTQPAVSSHLKLLEARIGQRLFERLARGIAPTNAAHELARVAGGHLDALEALVASANTGQEPLTGTVFIGGTSGLVHARLLPTLAPVIHEGLRLHVRVENSRPLVAAVAAGELDLALVGERFTDAGVELEPLYRATLMLVATPELARLAQAKPLPPSGLPLLDVQAPVSILEAYWREVFDASPEAASLVLPDMATMFAAVRAGAGLAILPGYMVSDALREGSLVVVHQPKKPPHNTHFLAFPKGKPISRRVLYVRDRLRAAAAHW